MPDFLRQHLRLFSQSGDVAAGPTLDVRDAKLKTSIQGALGLISEKLKELEEKEPKAAPPRPVGGAPGVAPPAKNAAGLFEISDPRELAQVSGMVNIPDSGNFANPELPSEAELATMSDGELRVLASQLKFVVSEKLRKHLPGVIKAHRHIVEHGLSDFSFHGKGGYLIERVRTLFPTSAEKYLIDIGVAQLKGHERSTELKEYFMREDAREVGQLQTPRIARQISMSREGVEEEQTVEDYTRSLMQRAEAPSRRYHGESFAMRSVSRLRPIVEEPPAKRQRMGPVNLPELKDLDKFTVRPQEILGKHAREFKIHGEGILTAEKRVLELQKAVFLENAFREHKLTDPHRELTDKKEHDALQKMFRARFPNDQRNMKHVLDLHARRRTLPKKPDTLKFDDPFEGGTEKHVIRIAARSWLAKVEHHVKDP
jgi:hypothetical protein